MLNIHLFGYLRLFAAGEAIPFTTLPKTQPLLAYLLLHRHEAVARDSLAFLLWDDVPESEARANLRRHLHDLNKALPPAPADSPWLLRAGTTLQWNPAVPFWLDVAEFEARCDAPHQLAEAVTLYTGDLLPHLYDDWLIPERERLQMRYLNALMQLIDRERARGDLRQAQMVAQLLLNHDPLREDAVREMMALRYELGDRSGAMQVYQRYHQRLAEELGVAPMPETVALYETISQNKPLAISQQPPVKTEPVAEREAITSPPHNLPAQLTPFIGRREEVTAVSQLIGRENSPTRLLTITGPGGTGKTRLSLQVANNLLAKDLLADELRPEQPACFPDGLYFVGLSSLTDPAQVVTAVAEVLGVREENGRSLLDSLKTNLQSKRLLLILDNFEHVLAAAAAMADLLTAVPGLRLLVTSQAVLHLYGEYEYPLAPLPLPQPGQSLPTAELLNYAAITLFVARVQAVQPGFTLTEANSEAVVAICRQLDGMPLALELAAARSKLFTPAAMLAQLNNRLRFLTGQARNLAARQQTLRATLDWSYNLLEPAEQAAFNQLTVFVGSFNIAAAEAVLAQADGYAALDLLAALADKNMLRHLPPSESETEPRFRMLQTLREYGLEKLAASGAEATTHRCYAAYYLEQAEQAELGLRSSEQRQWLAWLRQEDHDLMNVLNWLFQQTDDPANGTMMARLAVALERFWGVQGRYIEARLWLERAVPFADHLSPTDRMRLFNKAGNVCQWLGDYETAVTHHRHALTLARQTNDQASLAHTLHFLGNVAGRQGDYETARTTLEESLVYHRTLPDILPVQIMSLLNNLAIVYRRLGDYAQAADLLQETLAIREQAGDMIGRSSVLSNLGGLAVLQADLARAQTLFRQSLQIRLEINDRLGLVNSLHQMAELALVQEQFVRSVTLFAAGVRQRELLQVPMTADTQADYDRDMERLRTVLETAVFAQAWETGAAMTLDEAAAYAVTDPPTPNS
jgi:predicted ATPase/DNA-binding SARP family transcriptional activator